MRFMPLKASISGGRIKTCGKYCAMFNIHMKGKKRDILGFGHLDGYFEHLNASKSFSQLAAGCEFTGGLDPAYSSLFVVACNL
jgi:hypothetical protein